jgi:very-short-patch-repair endonuclease
MPNCYKIDMADTGLKLAIEVDGGSHGSLIVQERDRRKDALLVGSGWTVLRFSNQQVMERLEECVQMVTSTISKLKGTST